MANRYFCNECYYWFRLGGMMLHKDVKCPECHSLDVVKKNLTYPEQSYYADLRVSKRREVLGFKDKPPIAEQPIIPIAPHVIEAGQGSEEYSVNKGFFKKITGKR